MLIPNLNPENLKKFGINKTPVIIATDKDGKILEKYSPFNGEKEENFLKN